MAKLGTRDPPPRAATRPTDGRDTREQAPVPERCTFCSGPARHRCERCERRLCARHAIRRAQMRWVTYTFNGSYVMAHLPWTRYQPVASWVVCPACAGELDVIEARERAHDRRNVLRRRIEAALIVALWRATYGMELAHD